MNNENRKIEKLCGFYVSEWHLVTMILPYINDRVEKGEKIITILENSIEEKMKILLEKLNLKNKENILKINWKNIKPGKYTEIKKVLSNEVSKNNNNIILVNGCKEYIAKNNEIIDKWIKKGRKEQFKIIDLYEITEFNNNIMNILDTHDKILNTSGEKEITEVFDGYVRNRSNEQSKENAS